MQDNIAILAQFDVDFGNLWFIIALLVIAGARALGEKLKNKAEGQSYKKKIPPVTHEPGQPRPPRPTPPAQRRPRPPAPARTAGRPVIVIAPDEGPEPQLTQPAAPRRARPATPRAARAQAEPSEPMLVELKGLERAKPTRAHPHDKLLHEKKPATAAKPRRRKFSVNRKAMRRAIIMSEILRPPIALRENEACSELA